MIQLICFFLVAACAAHRFRAYRGCASWKNQYELNPAGRAGMPTTFYFSLFVSFSFSVSPFSLLIPDSQTRGIFAVSARSFCGPPKQQYLRLCSHRLFTVSLDLDSINPSIHPHSTRSSHSSTYCICTCSALTDLSSTS